MGGKLAEGLRKFVEQKIKTEREEFEEINGWIVLKSKYDVHHINGIKTDNSIENLQVMTRSEHMKLHKTKK